MRWCKRCVLPDTRPGLVLDAEGVCAACRAHEQKCHIDWEARRDDLARLLSSFRNPDKPGYDCLIPVSGGKDSTWQVRTILDHGLTPLAVTARPALRTPLGKRNLDNLIELGVDHIDYAINPRIERAIMRKTLLASGSPSLVEHLAGWGITLKTAVKFGIPLVVWGENSAVEYCGADPLTTAPVMTLEWLRRYGATDGTVIEDWEDEDIPLKKLYAYLLPTPQELEAVSVRAIFLGQYLNWEPHHVAEVARSLGLGWADQPVVGAWPFADLDSDFIVVHHFLKWYKFGFTRTFDNLSVDIRNGRISREQALEYLREHPERPPVRQIETLCGYLDLPLAEFWQAMERFRNRDIWHKDVNDRWWLPDFIPGVDFHRFFPDAAPSLA